MAILKSLPQWVCLISIVSVSAASGAAEVSSPAIIDFDYEIYSTIPPGPPPYILFKDPTLGWSFRPSVDIEVTALGFFDYCNNGFESPHLLGLWRADGTALREVQLDKGLAGTPVGRYRYSTIEAVQLTAGELYVIGASIPYVEHLSTHVLQVVDICAWDITPGIIYDDSVVLDSHIEIVDTARYHSGDPLASGQGAGTLRFPEAMTATDEFFAPNFTFTVVPEPCSLAVLGLGCLFLVRSRSR